jgi:hypothetical protein
MYHKSKAANAGLLSYGINTKPDPLEVSPKDGNPSMASLVITVSNNSLDPIYCNKIVFSFPIGDLAQDLASTSKGILVSAEPSDKWNIAMTGDGTFTVTPKKPEDNLITTDGISFNIFNIQVNKQVGIFTLNATEITSNDNIHFEQRSNDFEIGKFPYGFYVSNFAASAPMVKNGDQVTLTWAGSDLAKYTMFFDTAAVDVTNVRSWLSGKLRHTTTFALQARVQYEGETLDTYLYVTVIVSDPDFTATTLRVLQASTLEGATQVGVSLKVTGDTTLANVTGKNITANEGLTVSGNTSVKSVNAASLTVDGDGKIGNLTANNSLVVNGSSTLNNVVVKGPFNAYSSFSALKSGVLLASGTSIQAKYFTAKTDGFIVSYTGYPDNISKMSNVIAQLYSAGIWLQNLGGSTGTFGAAWSDTMVANPNSMCIPVAAGTTGGYGGYQMDKNQLDSTMWFYWFALGTAPMGENTFEMLDSAEGEEPPPPRISQMPRENSAERESAAYDFVARLESAFGKEVSEELKHELAAMLSKL